MNYEIILSTFIVVYLLLNIRKLLILLKLSKLSKLSKLFKPNKINIENFEEKKEEEDKKKFKFLNTALDINNKNNKSLCRI